jgi:uncharacterized protein YdbL (DUF1318 family)
MSVTSPSSSALTAHSSAAHARTGSEARDYVMVIDTDGDYAMVNMHTNVANTQQQPKVSVSSPSSSALTAHSIAATTHHTPRLRRLW